MSLLVVGLSHRSSPIALLERAALDAEGSRRLAGLAVAPVGGPGHGAGPPGDPSASESLVLATCNRVELYAEAPAFHPAVHHLTAVIAQVTGIGVDELADHLYFHHGDRAVHHLFTVASGLDSMALGEAQVLGQVRAALRRGQDDGTVGRSLQHLVQQGLRVGKRVQSETGLGRAGASLVESGLAGADALLGGTAAGRSALVVGAGSMSALAAATLRRHGTTRVTVANRSASRGRRLAEQVGGAWVALDDVGALTAALAGADVVVTCTGATGVVLPTGVVAAARELRGGAAAGDQLLVDLALPHDVDPAAGDLPGVHLVTLAALREREELARGVEDDVAHARAIVAEEVQAHRAAERAAVVAPTVAALRAQAADVVEGELARLRHRSAAQGHALDPRTAAELELTVHRVVEKLLHTPSVRVKALAAGSDAGVSYAAALRELFDLPVDLAGTGPDGAPAVGEVLRSVPARRASPTGAVGAAGGGR